MNYKVTSITSVILYIVSIKSWSQIIIKIPSPLHMSGSLVSVPHGPEVVAIRHDNIIVLLIVVQLTFFWNFYQFLLKLEKLVFSSYAGHRLLEYTHLTDLNVEKTSTEFVVPIDSFKCKMFSLNTPQHKNKKYFTGKEFYLWTYVFWLL